MTNFASIVCGKCGIEFGVPHAFDTEQRQQGKNGGFFCPNGHAQVYSESESDKLRRERDRLSQRLAEKDDDIRREREGREAAERKAAAARGQVTRIKKRVGNGVCPCCTRSFTNLRRHMEAQHPEYRADNVVEFKAEQVA